jgi:membrane associated rhomboid family serine protease
MIPLRDTQPSYSSPFVTIAIIAVNIAVFLLEVSLDPYSRNHFIATYGLVPDRFQFTALVTSMFLHGGWMHIIGNMWFLWIFGDNVEDILGHGKYLVFYLLCGIGAAFAQAIVNLDSRVPMVGASGAIAGVMGAYMVKFPRSTIHTLIPLFIFFTTVEVPAVLMLLYWFAIQVFSGFGEVGSLQGGEGGVAWFAHVGGFVAGAILVITFRTKDRFRLRRDLNW